ncbi:HlyIII-domain-containing protein [Mollisia scopiformis]|uniref:HlyIII-domain-containing protein n=1 Tax=Mollisia scopiformis TaxID=149040 RepID=A0A132B685_MOLSC|nr:HlyIII-domain-containing protein [Mollisia scopiformis]KUJ07509.1 HlyIII-domain-containing protein [Mollisia scopiformis]
MSLRQRRPSTTEAITDAAKNLEKSIENALTVLWDDLPSWQQDNHYIHSGYRPASASFKNSFASLGYIHNESVNIYSHLLGAVMFSGIGTVLYASIKPRYPSATSADIFAFGCFFAGAAACLGMSATYHAISNHSPMVAKFGNKLDYVGIVFLITGSFIPSIYYGFYCHPHLQEFYWTMICSLGIGCASVSVFERFRTPAWRPYRAGMFVLMGLSAVFPVVHGVEMYGIEDMKDRIGLTWLVLQGFLYILGAGLYAARWPERSWPGSFDIWGSSHQIFHVLVVMAAGSHLYGLLKAFDFHHNILGLVC